MPRRTRTGVVRFWTLFLLLIAAFSAASSSGAAERYVHGPLISAFARLATLCLAPFGPARLYDTVVEFGEFRIEVIEECDGTLPLLLYAAAVLAFPASWAARAGAIVCGAPLVLLINLLRLVSLVLWGAWRPELFEGVHIYVWQALVIALSLALWMAWVGRVVRRGA